MLDQLRIAFIIHIYGFVLCFDFVFETGALTQAGLKLPIVKDNFEPAIYAAGIEPRALCMLGKHSTNLAKCPALLMCIF